MGGSEQKRIEKSRNCKNEKLIEKKFLTDIVGGFFFFRKTEIFFALKTDVDWNDFTLGSPWMEGTSPTTVF